MNKFREIYTLRDIERNLSAHKDLLVNIITRWVEAGGPVLMKFQDSADPAEYTVVGLRKEGSSVILTDMEGPFMKLEELPENSLLAAAKILERMFADRAETGTEEVDTRQASCFRCALGKPHKYDERKECDVTCTLDGKTKRKDTACVCPRFESKDGLQFSYGEDGVPIRNRTSLDIRTKAQWEEVGYRLTEHAKGVGMHPAAEKYRRGMNTVCTYYTVLETVDPLKDFNK